MTSNRILKMITLRICGQILSNKGGMMYPWGTLLEVMIKR